MDLFLSRARVAKGKGRIWRRYRLRCDEDASGQKHSLQPRRRSARSAWNALEARRHSYMPAPVGFARATKKKGASQADKTRRSTDAPPNQTPPARPPPDSAARTLHDAGNVASRESGTGGKIP